MKKKITLFKGQSFEVGDTTLTITTIGMTKQDREPARRHVDIEIETPEPNEAETDTVAEKPTGVEA